MAQITPYVSTYDVVESVKVSGLSLAREICLAFKVSQPMSLPKHFYKVSLSENVDFILFNTSFLPYYMYTNL